MHIDTGKTFYMDFIASYPKQFDFLTEFEVKITVFLKVYAENHNHPPQSVQELKELKMYSYCSVWFKLSSLNP